MQTRIKFLKDFQTFKVDAFGLVSPEDAKSLIAMGVAELAPAEPVVKADAETDPDGAIADKYEDDPRVKALEKAVADLQGEVKAANALLKKADRKPIFDIQVGTNHEDEDPAGGYRDFKCPSDGTAKDRETCRVRNMGAFMKDVRDLSVNRATGPTKRLAKWTTQISKAQGLDEGVDSEGNSLVPTEFANMLLQKSYEQAPVASRCFNMPINRDLKIPYIAETSRADGSRAGGVAAYWVDEAASTTKAKPTFGRLSLELAKLFAVTYLTSELMTDSPISLGPIITRLFAEEMSFKIDDAIIRGTGAGQPKGLLNSESLVQVNRATSSVLATADFTAMFARIYNRSRGNAVWFINQDVIPALLGLTLGNYPIYLPMGGIRDGFGTPTLLGRPIVEIEQCASYGTIGDVILADMSHYILATKVGGMRAEASIHVQFLTDEETLRFVMRMDGKPWWKTVLTPFKGSNTISPFVTCTSLHT